MEGIKVIKAELSDDFESIEIVPIGDAHIGDEWCDEQMLKDVINYVLEKPNRFVILNGDLINNAIKTSVSDTYMEQYEPEEQVKHVARLLLPIKDRILAMGSGNHEERTLKLTGIDPSRYMSVRLGIEDKYADNSFVLFLKVGKSHNNKPSRPAKQTYSIFVQHGYGGGKKNGSKLNNLNASDSIIADCDIYIMGHTHTLIANITEVFVTDNQNQQIYRKKKHYLMHNSYMDFGGYGLRQGFSPSAKDIGYLSLSTVGRKKIKLTLGS